MTTPATEPTTLDEKVNGLEQRVAELEEIITHNIEKFLIHKPWSCLCTPPKPTNENAAPT